MPPEPITAKILIVDAGPLTTLAAAASLDYLLYDNGTVIIPDAVFFEATRDASRLGANVIVEWANANLERIHIAPNNAFAAFTPRWPDARGWQQTHSTQRRRGSHRVPRDGALLPTGLGIA